VGTLSLLVPLAWRNLWRNPRRTFITLVVVAVGLYSILVFAAMLEAWAQSSRDTQLDLVTGSGQIHATGYLDDPTVSNRMPDPGPNLVAALGNPSITAWVKRVRVPAVIESEYKSLPLTLMGVAPRREAAISSIPHQIAEGTYLAGPDTTGIVLGQHLADRLKTRVGRRIIIMAQAADGSLAQRSFDVVGIFAGNSIVEDQFAFAGLSTVQTMLGLGTDISEISFKVLPSADLQAVVEALSAAAPGLDVKPWRTLSPLAAAVDDMMEAFVYVWLWIMFVFMAIGIANTQLMAVFERVREFGLLQALGMKPRLILILVSLEAVILVGVGCLVGMAASAATIVAISGGVDLGSLARGAEMFGASRVLYPSVTPGQFVEFSLIVWLLGIVVAFWPAHRAASASPVEAMSHLS
jgi:ABC-type lipoprotein release transport system permease subunit